jgi:hypothetical protein
MTVHYYPTAGGREIGPPLSVKILRQPEQYGFRGCRHRGIG